MAEHVETQAKFLDEELKPTLDAAQAGKGHVFFVDAAHFVLGTYLCCLWSFERIFVRAASGRQRFNVPGAWNAVTRDLIAVTNTTVDDHTISFDTTAVGVPHLVRVSYFPNWVAEGAEGPYHAAPSLMVVVPTQEHVVLEFRRLTAERVGIALTVVTLVGLTGLAVIRRRATVGSSKAP